MMKFFQHHKNNKGLTLVEIIVAIAILGFIAASFLTMFSSAFSGIFSMGRRTQAMNDDAQSIMERIHENYNGELNQTNYPDENNGKFVNLNKGVTILVTEGSGSNGIPVGVNLVTITVEYGSGRRVNLTGLVDAP